MAIVYIDENISNPGSACYPNPQLRSVLIEEDYVGGALTSTCTPSTVTNSGAIAYAGMSGRQGVVSLTTGAVSASGSAALGTNANVISFVSGGFMSLNAEVLLLTNLSTVAEAFTAITGFGDSVSAVAQTDGVYFRYTHSENAGNWTLVCEKAGVESTLDSGILVAASTWYNLRIEVYGSTSATFFIDNVNVGTITAEIPTSTDYTGVITGIFKSNGTSTRAYRIDWMYVSFVGPR